MDIKLTIMVPVYMEAENIRPTIDVIIKVLNKTGVISYEILIIDCLRPDGTDDGTPAIAAQLARENSKIRHIHNDSCVNLGFKYKQGAKEAGGEYYMMIPGDNETEEQAIINVLEKMGQADIIVASTSNPEVRPLKRRIIAKVFNIICNFISGLNLKHYNGTNLHKTDILRKLPMKVDNLVYSADIIIRATKSGLAKTYVEVPMPLRPQPNRKTNSFQGNNIVSALLTFLELFWDIRIKRKPL
ncbi:MAG: hypothetical protein A3B86_02630 [Candidatus Yanofskybacteria bacterium RIFCSPHIGHO2_02_FULL_38_22b]|uniref:Glycosyltransferase 2-like domain-containing protein n=1 Tax=Candidatus Yanofskybacteria bacterium RIFCSPHIGHO2_02_FULL_38_22b TaxID=1802673 RepID=A0A1F8F3P0_9BACT|nr:MAG: hypothetical protein A2816_03225 [Candidatus Yanofskybacteria bacterium RIFCSPHIGHO2_01_FULL_39_44]OGN07751.1 MAG: hypothetical protein A3B86_02630 [Candidatus Yanofskybacteria bacterium RIFCSPHIGHO2_02_FULL_38_22b]